MHRRTFFQRTRQRAGQRDLQSIQNPGDPERKHDAGVKAAPGQAVETRRNAGFDNAIIAAWRKRRHRSVVIKCRAGLRIHDRTNEKAVGTLRSGFSSEITAPLWPATSTNVCAPGEFPHCGKEPIPFSLVLPEIIWS